MFAIIGENLVEWTKSDPVYDQHRAYMVAGMQNGTFLCSGPREGGGSVIIAYGDDRDALQAVIDADPFAVAGYEKFTVHPFTVGLADPASSLA